MLARSPFVTLTSWDANGAADVSPKGDPAGFLRFDAEGRVAIADRPGNRRTDTLHNLLEQPRLALLALVPGDDRVVEVTGSARLTTEPGLLASMAVAGKVPKIAVQLDALAASVTRSPAIAAARLWDPSRHAPKAELPAMAAVFIDHVKRNKQRGVAAAVIRTLASERVMHAALSYDYKKKMY